MDENHMFRINETDEEYLTYRTLATDPDIMDMYKQNWKRIHSIPIYERRTFAMPVEPWEKDYTGNAILETYTISANDDWPELIMFPEEILDRRKPIYYVGVDFDYFQEQLVQGMFPEVGIEVTELQYPTIVPYNDPYVYNVRVKTKEDIFAIERSRQGGTYLLVSPCQYKTPHILLTHTNLYPTQEENYSACFTNKYIAETYAKSVEAYIVKLANLNLHRMSNDKHRFN